MSLRIRLRRVGRKKQPSYRIVVTDRAAPRDGAYVDTVGFYNPRREPAALELDLEKVDRWLAQGAELTDTAASLVRKARKGGDAKVALIERAAAPAPAAAEVTEAAAPAAEAAEAAPVVVEAAAPEAEAEAPAPEAKRARKPRAAAEAAPAESAPAEEAAAGEEAAAEEPQVE